MEGSFEDFFAAVYPHDRGQVQQALDDCIRNGRFYAIERRVVWPDGTTHWCGYAATRPATPAQRYRCGINGGDR